MKVLWFTNIPMPEVLGAENREHAVSGGWMLALMEQLTREPDVELSIACVAPGLPDAGEIAIENRRFLTIRQGPAWRLFGFRNPDNDPRYLDRCVQVVHRVNPDIIHIHGTERFYGLLGARRMVSAPVVISLQGLLHDYATYQHYFGVTPLRDVLALHDPFHLVRGMGPFFSYLHLRRSAKRELEIMRGNRWFMGRTLWDQTHLAAVNPGARYFHVPELLRPGFYGKHWDIAACWRHRVIFTNANSFGRGTETLLGAIAILKREYPDISLALAGGVETLPYGRRLLRRIAALGLQGAVEFLGRLNEEQMVHELCRAHVFAITSLSENSPNSLCEAQLVGLPCVASYAGGIPSLVKEGESGLLFPPGDAPVLAERIRTIFLSDELACNLSARARQSALTRHDLTAVTRMVLETYEEVMREAEIER